MAAAKMLFVLALCVASCAALRLESIDVHTVRDTSARLQQLIDSTRMSKGLGDGTVDGRDVLLFHLSRQEQGGGGNETEPCDVPFVQDRVMTVSGTETDDPNSPAQNPIATDLDLTFFTDVLGYSAQKTARIRRKMLRYFKNEFGLRLNQERPLQEIGTLRRNQFVVIPFFFDFPFYKTADSAKVVGTCPTADAVWGGFMVTGTLKLGGSSNYASDDFIKKTILLYTFMVFAPDGPYTTIIEQKSKLPLLCNKLSACPFVDRTEFADSVHADYTGLLDGTFITEPTGVADRETLSVFGTLTWPGRRTTSP